MSPEQRTVLLALNDARSTRLDHAKWPESIVVAMPAYMTRTASGRPQQPMGLRRVRRVLNELCGLGYTERLRSFYGLWKVTPKGERETTHELLKGVDD